MADWGLAIAVGAGIVAVSGGLLVDKLTKRMDRVDRAVTALFEYAKEIDPRHDEERSILYDLDAGGLMAGEHHLNLVRAKRERGERTLLDPLLPRDDR